jgi:hypothetical protein
MTEMSSSCVDRVEFGLPALGGFCQTWRGRRGFFSVQPVQAKRALAVAIGLVVLGVVIWVSAKSHSNQSAGAAIPTVQSGLVPEALVAQPEKIVTMVSVPEVIYSSVAVTDDSAHPPEDKASEPAREREDKPSPPSHDTDVRVPVPAHANAAPRKPASGSSRHSADTFLVKPE